MAGFAAKLLITDGTASGTVDLLSPASGFSLQDWIPATSTIKGGGTWQDSLLANGRKPIHRRWANASETFELTVRNFQQDAVIRDTQILRRLLEKAAQYWTTEWQNGLVWIEARGPCETNSRYAIIYDWRTPQDGNPYAEPFQNPAVMAGFESFPLILERRFWQDTQPGTGECVPISAVQTYHWDLWNLEFDPAAQARLDCTSDAALDDLVSTGNFCAEAWIRADGYGGNGQGRIFDKDAFPALGVLSAGWHFLVDSTYGLFASAACATQNAVSRTTRGFFEADGEWHHVVMQWDGTVIWLAVDGVPVTYSLQQACAGAPVADAAYNLYVGNYAGTVPAPWSRGFDGGIGWARVSNSGRYPTAAVFTPPDRCILPPIDILTIAQWIGPESAGATIDNQEGTASRDGTQTNCTFDDNCDYLYGNTDGSTCADEVFVANKHNLANITDIYYYDAAPAGFSANLMGAALPYAFFPAVPAVGDIVYFGINTAFADSGPFCSLVFDIGTAQNDLTIVWEIWNGAWVALPAVQDNTATAQAFDTTGVNSVHWGQDAVAWTTTAVNGVTGYWVRARVTAIGAAPSPPTQQNRDIYSVVWPYIDIDEDEIGGDIAALAQEKIRNVSFEGLAQPLFFNRFLVGLRSLERGEDFSAYINIADEQNDLGITVTADIATVFQNDITAPTGRSALYTPVATGTWNSRAYIQFSDALSTQYYGRFHTFLRVKQTGGVIGDIEAYLELIIDPTTRATTLFTTSIASPDAVGYMLTLDFGQIVIPSNVVSQVEEVDDLAIVIQGQNLNAVPGTATLTIYDLILMPVDECAIEAVDTLRNSSASAITLYNDLLLNADSITYPKKMIRTLGQKETDDEIRLIYRPITAGPTILQSNADQRLWFFGFRDFTPPLATNIWAQDIETVHTVRINKNQRYFSMRGAR